LEREAKKQKRQNSFATQTSFLRSIFNGFQSSRAPNYSYQSISASSLLLRIKVPETKFRN